MFVFVCMWKEEPKAVGENTTFRMNHFRAYVTGAEQIKLYECKEGAMYLHTTIS